MKKILSFFVAVFVIINLLGQVFALSEKQKGAILSKYQEEQKDFIFENISDINALEALNLFKVNTKKNIYENVLKNVGDQRKKLEEENLRILKNIDDLNFQLKNLDKQINDLKKEIRKINNEIVKKTIEIQNKKNKAKEIEEKLNRTTQILRKYIVYIYKKGNLFVEDGKIDNFKAILLSGDSLDKVINDIYFKELLAQTGKNLIKQHRKLIFKLYVEKKILENDTFAFKQLRKKISLKKKIIENKKSFKAKILGISKGKDALYKRYIKTKRETERGLRVKAFAEKMKFYSASKKVLGKYGCEFVDVSKNTPKVRLLSPKCYNLNKIISLEAKLEENKDKNQSNTQNIFSWPISPYNGISAYFKDKEYQKVFKAEHKAIDIRAPQGTNIKAPADGYVIDIKKPLDSSYAYIVLKHSNGFVTVYGHISEVLDGIEKYSYIKAGDIFAKTGGMFGTYGAGYITTGPHLHFEVLKDKQWVDPLNYLNLSYLNYKNIPEYLRIKFQIDYKQRTGKEYLSKKEYSSRRFILEGNTEIERQKSLLRKYARSDFSDWNLWVSESLRWHIDPTFTMCIGLAETGLGRHLKTPYNIGNVGNVDSGGTWTMQSPRQGIWWIGHTLNNKILGKYNSISKLSRYGNKTGAIYASSSDHWHRNIIKCMSVIKGFQVPDDYNFRTY